MFYDKPAEIPKIAARTSCAIFVTLAKPKLLGAVYLEPEEGKATISVEQIREFLALSTCRETSERFFVIRPAETLSEAAENALLKTLEEPGEHTHFVLLTEEPSRLLPTIRSRAQIFFPRVTGRIDEAPKYSAKTMTLAKQLIAAAPLELPGIAAEYAKKKPSARQAAMDATAAAIELLEKSYFKTGNAKFLTKLPNFLRLHQALSENGHVKLHIVADLC